MKAYEIRFTRLARVFAEAKYSLAAVEERARGEIAELEMDDPTALMMHCFGMTGTDEHEFICTPDQQGTGIVIDTVTFEDMEPLRSGPMKGKRFQWPMPDSDADA